MEQGGTRVPAPPWDPGGVPKGGVPLPRAPLASRRLSHPIPPDAPWISRHRCLCRFSRAGMHFPPLSWFLECPEASLESSGTPWGRSAVLEPPRHLARATPPMGHSLKSPRALGASRDLLPALLADQQPLAWRLFVSRRSNKAPEGLPGWGQWNGRPGVPMVGAWGCRMGGAWRKGQPWAPQSRMRAKQGLRSLPSPRIGNLSYVDAESSAGIWGLWPVR